MDTLSTFPHCDLCKYWSWRLKDMRLSKDKAINAKTARQLHGCVGEPLVGVFDDYSHVRKALENHILLEHHA
jgi:hypothetical protein